MKKYFHKYYAPFLSLNIHEDVSIGTEYEPEKCTVHCHKNDILGLLLKKSNSF